MRILAFSHCSSNTSSSLSTTHTTMALPFQALKCSKTLATHVFVGMGAASFWRGAWYVLDDHLFPNNAELSAAVSLTAGTVGMAASQGLVARAERLSSVSPLSTTTSPSSSSAKTSSTIRSGFRRIPLQLARFGALYTVAVSCVLIWRGTWVGWDCVYERIHPEQKSTDPGHATRSGVLSHVAAVAALLGTGLFASVLAPPAAVSVIRDVAVKATKTAGSRSKQQYQGPAQAVANRLFGGLSSQRKLSTRVLSRKSAAGSRRSTTKHAMQARRTK